MRTPALHSRSYTLLVLAAFGAFLFASAIRSSGQSSGSERTFPQSKTAVESALRQMESATSGRLPVVDGFATSTDHPLEAYRRGYYQAKFQVSALPAGGSVVRVSVEVTAWYADPKSGASGYQLLKSTGRLEADMLDQLADQLAGKNTQAGTNTSPEAAQPSSAPAANSALQTSKPQQSVSGQEAPQATIRQQSAKQPPTPQSVPGTAGTSATSTAPTVLAPVPQLPSSGGGILSSLAQTLAEQQKGNKASADSDASLRAEADSLEQILKNQAHPRNLVAVKKSGTPVVDSASLNAKTLFLADAHDEFEMLDFNRDWVHVRISGLSRGWIWRNSLEMPDGIADSDAPASPAPVAEELFRVSREEIAQFPGDWAPLRGQNTKIVTVEKINEAKEAGVQLRLEFVKSLLEKDYDELVQKSGQLAGIVVIFDSSDGGMVAATLATLRQWKAGTLSDAALWHQCFFDPPETFNASTVSPSQ